jgi:hypothetical protein|nr:MAG TPA: hypothetical protein [Caudoviricetes sp.]
MIKSGQAYHAAITGDARRVLLRAVIDIISPDIVFGAGETSGQIPWSNLEQIHDKVFGNPTKYATLERDRWALDGTWDLLPDDPTQTVGQMGYIGNVLSGEDGTFATPPWVELRFSGVSVLQACSVYFPGNAYDGVPEDFTVEVKQGGTAYHTRTYTGNTASSVSLEGFTVNNPDAIRVTVAKWSRPSRRMRVVEIVPGVYETWDGGMIAEFSVKQQGNVAATALPYGTCTLKIDNLSRRFEPRSKNGIFQSIEERQGIDVSLGVRLADGTDEYKRLGIFYQFSGGWRTGDNGLTMQWNLADIIGLLANREFLAPSTLPTTLGGWIGALAAQLGVNFKDRWHVDPDYTALPVTVRTAEDVQGKKCGDILRWVCQATGTWPRADASTGELTAEPLWSEGNRVTLDNLNSYPTMKANGDVAALIFTLNDGADTKYIVSGNATSSSETVSIDNPFIKTEVQALAAARLILSTYGGNVLDLTGRGDPSSEIGDVETVWLDESQATTARLTMQTFQFSGGVMQGCQSQLLQADGSFLYQGREVITSPGTWKAPAGKKSLRVILVGKGGDGTRGQDGTWDAAGADGVDGLGGLVWAGTININDGQEFPVAFGENTTFGAYSSANGKRYENGYTDVASGDSFARTGVAKPRAGTGDGGAKGTGGTQGRRHRETSYDLDGNPSGSYWEIDAYPGIGTNGKSGVLGCVVVYWDKEDT